MRYLSGDEEKKALEHINNVAGVAKNATCERSKCGSVIVRLDEIIGSGFNSPPQDIEEQRRCSHSKDFYHKKVTDKTCCVHAEQRAIIDALRKNSDKLSGSRLYFVRLDVGIVEFVLWHDEGVCVYDTKEYNELSFQFGMNRGQKQSRFF